MPIDARGRLIGRTTGWYAVGFSEEIGRRLVRRRLLGDDLIIARAGSRQAVVISEPSGRRLPSEERHGVILAYVGDEAPAWAVRPIEAEYQQLAWSKPAGRTWTIRTHPQEIIENTVDVAHFASVHGYEAIEISEGMKTAGPHLTMSYTVTRNRGLFGRFDRRRLRFRLDITASGIGYSRVQIRGMGMRLRTVVMPTPIDDEYTEVRAITQIALWPGAEHPLARWLPRQRLADHLARIGAIEMGRDFAADIRIWETKRYRDPPRLVAGDGPIGPYRTWARQFYVREERSAA